MRDFGHGARMLLRGFGWWRRDPGVMALGLLPGVIVALVFAGGLIALSFALEPLTVAMTPFAADWPEVWRTVVRFAVGTAVVGGSLVLLVVSFTAVTLLIGEPFYDRVWRSVERASTGAVPSEGYGWGAAAADSVCLVVRGLGVALLAALLGLIPVVGAACGAVIGFFLTARLVADELSSRALTARGLDRRARRILLRGHRARVWGFGVATQLCFLVPLGAVLVMPAAVAGSTLLALSLLDEPRSRPAARRGRRRSSSAPSA